jgi:hypothetical protein
VIGDAHAPAELLCEAQQRLGGRRGAEEKQRWLRHDRLHERAGGSIGCSADRGSRWLRSAIVRDQRFVARRGGQALMQQSGQRLDEDHHFSLTATAHAEDQIVVGRFEAKDRGLAAGDDIERSLDDVRFETAAADRAPCLPVAPDEQPRTGAPVGRAIRLDDRRKGAIAAAGGVALLEDTQQFHTHTATLICLWNGISRMRGPPALAIAFASAGATTHVGGSPTPVGAGLPPKSLSTSSLGRTKYVSTFFGV